MRKVGVLLFFAVLLSVSGSAQIDSTISEDNCPADHVPLISMPDPDASYGNPAPPSMYDHKVCVTGVDEVQFGDRCRAAPAFYLSSNTTTAHFSQQKGYNIEVCAGKMMTAIKDQCEQDETPLFSVSDRINGFGRHVAGVEDQGPKVFSNVVCGFYRPPENVTLSMEFNLSDSDEVYFDDDQIEPGFNYSGLAEFPYIISTNGTHTAGIVATSFKEVERILENRNILKMKKDANDASFFVPFTEGNHQSVESSQHEFLEEDFLNQVDPSFGFRSPTHAIVRTMIDTDVDIRSNLSVSRGRFQVKIEKTGDNQITVQTE